MAMPVPSGGPRAVARAEVISLAFLFVVLVFWQAAVFEGVDAPGNVDGSVLQEAGLMTAESVQSQCLKGKWLYFYGDSLVRGYFLDIVRAQGILPRPGPADVDMETWKAQLSPPEEDCKEHTTTYWGKQKCVFWEYSTGQEGSKDRVVLTYRAKFSVYNSTVDDPVIHGVFRSDGGDVPDALVTSSGFWDMLWENDDDKYMEGLTAYLGMVRRRYEGVVLWTEVTCTNGEMLTGNKKERMTCARALEYNRASRPVLEDHNVAIVPAHEITRKNPSQTRDGIHFPGFVSRAIACGVLNSGVCLPTQKIPCSSDPH